MNHPDPARENSGKAKKDENRSAMRESFAAQHCRGDRGIGWMVVANRSLTGPASCVSGLRPWVADGEQPRRGDKQIAGVVRPRWLKLFSSQGPAGRNKGPTRDGDSN